MISEYSSELSSSGKESPFRFKFAKHFKVHQTRLWLKVCGKHLKISFISSGALNLIPTIYMEESW